MSTSQSRPTTQPRSRQARNGSFHCYVGEKGFEAAGRKHDGSALYLLIPTHEEFMRVIGSRFVGKKDKHGQPSGWRSYRGSLGPETVVDGTISRSDGRVWEVTMTSNCALAIVASYDNRPPARETEDVSVLDAPYEEAQEEDLI